jgi:uncharacterized protein YndB with AHSA1/START domain
MTRTTYNTLELVVDETLPLFRATREFDFAAADVFRAHVDPALLVQWLGPRRLSMRLDEWDCRTGGCYRSVHLDEDGSEYGFYGSFHEVIPEQRIVQTFTYAGEPQTVALEVMEFVDLAGGRSLVRQLFLVDSIEARDGFLASGMESGATESYERIDDLQRSGALRATARG